MKKTTRARKLLAGGSFALPATAVVSAAALVALTGCVSTNSPSPAPSAASSASAAPTDGAEKAHAKPSEPVALSGSFTDEALGDTVAVSKVWRNVKIPAYTDDQELIAVEMTITRGDHTGGVQASGLDITANGKSRLSFEVTDFDDQLAAMGIAPKVGRLSDDAPTQTGWVLYRASTKQDDTIELTYNRSATRMYVIGGGGKTHDIPAETFRIPLSS